MTTPLLTELTQAVFGVTLPMETTITTRWFDADGNVLLEYQSGSREPFWLPQPFLTYEQIVALYKAAGEAVERGRQ